MSSRTVAYEWPLCLAKSSTPSTVDLPDRWVEQRSYQPQQGEPGHRSAERVGQAGTGPPRRCQCEAFQQTAQPHAAALVPLGQPVDLLGERRYQACRHIAPEPADLQLDHHRAAATGQVMQATPVPVV